MTNKYLDKVASTRFVKEVLALGGKSVSLPKSHSTLKSMLSSKSYLSPHQLSQLKGNIRIATPSNARAYYEYDSGYRLRRLPDTIRKFIKQPMLSNGNMPRLAQTRLGMSEYMPGDILQRWVEPARDHRMHPSHLRYNFSRGSGRNHWVSPPHGIHDGYGSRRILDPLGTKSLAKLPK
ncbi:MAG TPA: hypothetical protein VFM18_05255 [Methanosarcina sp.]|nr:hypothetical protein [Methanosarcina sp.]